MQAVNGPRGPGKAVGLGQMPEAGLFEKQNFPRQLDEVKFDHKGPACRLDYLGHGNVGVAYLSGPPSGREVVKLGFKGQSGLFAAEKTLLMDFANSQDLVLRPLKEFLVPTRPIEMSYRGQRFAGLKKEWVDGVHLDSPSLYDSKALTTALTRLFDLLKEAHGAGYLIDDLHERNLVWSPKEEKLTIIDGAAGRKATSVHQAERLKSFEDMASLWEWPKRVGLIQHKMPSVFEIFPRGVRG